jgi:hypothetical protein
LIHQRRLTPSCGRAGPYRGENSGLGKDDRGELDIETRNQRTQSALLGPHEMTDLSPQSGPKRTLISRSHLSQVYEYTLGGRRRLGHQPYGVSVVRCWVLCTARAGGDIRKTWRPQWSRRARPARVLSFETFDNKHLTLLSFSRPTATSSFLLQRIEFTHNFFGTEIRENCEWVSGG